MKTKSQLQFSFDGQKLVGTLHRTRLEIDVHDWVEIGVEIVHDVSRRQIWCLVINRCTHNLRIPNDAPLCKVLLDYCSTLEGFDWKPLARARLNSAHAYSICWQRSVPALSAVLA
jgi:hypothetical protein